MLRVGGPQQCWGVEYVSQTDKSCDPDGCRRGALAFSQSARAELLFTAEIGGGTFEVADNDADDVDGTDGVLRIDDQTVAGINVRGSIQSARKNDAGLNLLNSSSLEVRSVSGSPLAVWLVVSDTDFPGLSTTAFTSASGTFERASGSTINLSWFADASNEQGGESITDTPGGLLDSFSFTASGLASSFRHDGGPFSTRFDGPYSMTLAFDYLLAAGGTLLSRGATVLQNVQGVPEPAAVGLLGPGLLAIGLRRRTHAWLNGGRQEEAVRQLARPRRHDRASKRHHAAIRTHGPHRRDIH